MKPSVAMLVRNAFGPDVRVARQARALAGAGYEVHVFATSQDGFPQTQDEETFTVRRIAPCRGSAFDRRAASEVARLQPAVVHCHDSDTLVAGYWGALRAGAKLVIDAHELWLDRNHGLSGIRASWDWLKFGVIESWVYRRAQAVVTVSDGIAQHLIANYGLRDIHILRNAPPRPDFHASPLPRPKGPRTLALHLGGIQPHRGLGAFLEALAKDAELGLWMVGNHRAADRERLQQRARALSVHNQVFFDDGVAPDDIPSVARQADVGICLIEDTCLSYRYCLPNKLFEYGFAGLPVVVTMLPDLAACVEHHRLGEIATSLSAGTLVPAIRKAVARGFMSDTDRIQFVEQYCWERAQTKLLAFYDALADVERALP